MVSITRSDDKFIFEVLGLHKLWALKSQLTIPASHIIKAYPNTKKLNGFFGLRMPGTQIPGVITAGTYWVDDGTIFVDVSNYDQCIVVELENEHYKRLVIQVKNAEEAIALLMNK
jgi:hypothetical protein